jgi:hypothetical protein
MSNSSSSSSTPQLESSTSSSNTFNKFAQNLLNVTKKQIDTSSFHLNPDASPSNPSHLNQYSMSKRNELLPTTSTATSELSPTLSSSSTSSTLTTGKGETTLPASPLINNSITNQNNKINHSDQIELRYGDYISIYTKTDNEKLGYIGIEGLNLNAYSTSLNNNHANKKIVHCGLNENNEDNEKDLINNEKNKLLNNFKFNSKNSIKFNETNEMMLNNKIKK